MTTFRERAAHSFHRLLSLHFLKFLLFTILVLMAVFRFGLYRFLVIAYFLLSFFKLYYCFISGLL